MVLLWICFIVFILYFVGYETYWGTTKYKQIIKKIKAGELQKEQLYLSLMLGLWIPTCVVLLIAFWGRFDLTSIGLGWARFSSQEWLVYISAVLASLYFLYLVYSLIALRINAIKKVSISQKIPDEIKILLPVTKKEKTIWAFTALTAGITEELLYRGFFFYLMGELYQGIPIIIVLLTSAVIFGIGHLYQGFGEAVKPAALGFVFGVFYIAFGSIIPCIILHTMQDLCAVDMINEESSHLCT